MLKKTIMAYVHQLLDQPSQWQTSQQAGPCSVPKFTSTSITVKHLLIKNQNINQSKSSLLIWHYVSYLFLYMAIFFSIFCVGRCICTGQFLRYKLDRVKRIWYLSPMRAAKVQASLRIRAVSPEPPLLAHTSSESRGTFSQKARSLAPLNGWACAVKVCHEGMLEDTNSLDGAQFISCCFEMARFYSYVYEYRHFYCMLDTSFSFN